MEGLLRFLYTDEWDGAVPAAREMAAVARRLGLARLEGICRRTIAALSMREGGAIWPTPPSLNMMLIF